jgi:cytochrome bd ubiquinol oxidase subunit II
MTVVALVLLPVVLCYQAWTYYVFRRRISAQDFRPKPPPPPPEAAAPAAVPRRGTGWLIRALRGSRS